jgi:hypothetical protein
VVFHLEFLASSAPLHWTCFLLPALLYGILAGSWWALAAPAVMASIVLETWTTGIENSDATWGEALAPVLFFTSAGAVAVGVLLSRGWQELRRAR